MSPNEEKLVIMLIMAVICKESLICYLKSNQVIPFRKDGRCLHHFGLYIWTMTTSKTLALLTHGGGR